jgi:hypothetical protein
MVILIRQFYPKALINKIKAYRSSATQKTIKDEIFVFDGRNKTGLGDLRTT